MRYSVITGATSGLGLAYAEILASEGRNLILVARNTIGLQEVSEHLTHRFGVDILSFPSDLSNIMSLNQLVTELRMLEIDTLINNAGFGIYDSFQHSGLENELRLINLTITAPMTLCHELIPQIIRQPNGLIINIGSIAGYLSASTYSAAKSWTKVFTEVLAFDLRKSPIKISCLTPGYLDTNFHNAAGNSIARIPKIFISDPLDVAKQSLKHARRGRIVQVPTLKYRILAIFIQYSPRPLIRRLSSLR